MKHFCPRDYTMHGNREASSKKLIWWFIYELWWNAEHGMWELWMLLSGKAEVELKKKQTLNFCLRATDTACYWEKECGRFWRDEMTRWDLRRRGRSLNLKSFLQHFKVRESQVEESDHMHISNSCAHHNSSVSHFHCAIHMMVKLSRFPRLTGHKHYEPDYPISFERCKKYVPLNSCGNQMFFYPSPNI